MKAKRIIYENKPIYLPFWIPERFLVTDIVEVSNHFSGQKTTLPKFAKAVRDIILMAEMQQSYKTVRKGLDWFIKYFPKQYMVLLD
jgi:hypothetical protein